MENTFSENPIVKKFRYTLELVKFSHTLFALPFALASFLVASRGNFEWKALLWVVACVLTARTAAMAFNRLADARFDALNPRTKDRHLPQGQLSRAFVVSLVLASSLAFLFSAYQLNRLAFILAPFCLILLFFYSLTKRFTHFTQFFLGLALSLAPVGAAIAATGEWNGSSFLLGGAVLCWVAGFDLLYALQDLEFDRAQGLHSLSVRFGIPWSFRVSALLHLCFVVLLIGYGWHAGLGNIYWGGLALTSGLLIWEHAILKEDLKKIQASFFTANGLLSLLYLGVTIADVLSSR